MASRPLRREKDTTYSIRKLLANTLLPAFALAVVAPNVAGSSNGRTPDTVSGDVGSTPTPAATPAADAGVAQIAYVYSLTAPAIDMPAEMARDVAAVWLGCEVRGAAQTPYTDLAAAINPVSGTRGQTQLHPIHREGMAARGLNFESEHDRIVYSVLIWEQQGWMPWACAP